MHNLILIYDFVNMVIVFQTLMKSFDVLAACFGVIVLLNWKVALS